MIACVLAAAVGAAVALVLWVASAGMFDVDALRRTNYRGAPVVTGVGVLVPATVAVVVAASDVVVVAGHWAPEWDDLGSVALLAAAGFGLLGVFDDVAGVGQSGGFLGHLRALGRGELTSGGVKLFGGAALGVVVASSVATGDGGVVALLRDGAVVALAANLANLFDRAPGRTTKLAALAFVAAAVVARNPTLAGPAVGVGAGLGLLSADLRERMMLGDAGSNPLGALCGLAWLVALPTPLGRWVLLVVLVALNAASEVVSYSSVIDRVGPLRWFDRLGSDR